MLHNEILEYVFHNRSRVLLLNRRLSQSRRQWLRVKVNRASALMSKNTPLQGHN